jgi:hypothetical protein
LAAVMNRMHQQLAPEQIANAPEFAISISDLAPPVVRLKPSHSRDGLVVHYTERGRERFYRSGAFDVWRFACVEIEFALVDA